MLNNSNSTLNMLDITLDQVTQQKIRDARITTCFKKMMRELVAEGKNPVGRATKLYDHVVRMVDSQPASTAMHAGFQAGMFTDSPEQMEFDYFALNAENRQKGEEYLNGLRLADQAFGKHQYEFLSNQFTEA